MHTAQYLVPRNQAYATLFLVVVFAHGITIHLQEAQLYTRAATTLTAAATAVAHLLQLGHFALACIRDLQWLG